MSFKLIWLVPSVVASFRQDGYCSVTTATGQFQSHFPRCKLDTVYWWLVFSVRIYLLPLIQLHLLPHTHFPVERTRSYQITEFRMSLANGSQCMHDPRCRPHSGQTRKFDCCCIRTWLSVQSRSNHRPTQTIMTLNLQFIIIYFNILIHIIKWSILFSLLF